MDKKIEDLKEKILTKKCFQDFVRLNAKDGQTYEECEDSLKDSFYVIMKAGGYAFDHEKIDFVWAFNNLDGSEDAETVFRWFLHLLDDIQSDEASVA